MTTRYFKSNNPEDESIYGFDVETQDYLIQKAIEDEWVEIDEPKSNTIDQEALKIKLDKINTINRLTVKISTGKIFDGNENSINLMMAALKASEITGIVKTEWKLANNNIEIITIEELKEALVLSIKEVGKIKTS